MDTVRLLVQNLIIIVVLAVLLEMLLPNGEMRRYTRMVLGLMVIVAVLQAVHGLSGGSLFSEVEEYAWRKVPGDNVPVNILEQGRKIEAENRVKAVEQYKKGLEKQILSLVALEGEVSLVGAEVQIQDDPGQKDFGKVRQVNLIFDHKKGIQQVDTVSVTVGEENREKPAAEIPPEYAGEAGKAARVVADFYNINQDQVKVKFGN